jgi:threonylcarbamoyladenosine tRNA methylthiotransferase MtaB
MKISILTLGCRTNQAESISLENTLRNEGHNIVEFSLKPDICIINTCTVTSKADYQSRQLINRAVREGSRVIVTGCFAELNAEYIKGLKDNVNIVSNNDKDKLISMIPASNSSINLTNKHKTRVRPIIKVQDGCNYSCSYCAIPQARGRSRSIPAESIIREVLHYETLGFNEVVLTGIHIGTYGTDLNVKYALSDLVEEILLKTSIKRLRLSSIEVKEVDDKLLDLMSDLRVCRHLHLPLQSGDDNLLKLMNRTYNSDYYIRMIDRIMNKFSDIAIGTDIIVGFPGEGENEFSNTLQVIEKLPFSYIHVFPYSKRPNTKAIELSGHVADKIKKYRASILRELSTQKKKAFIEKHIGITMDIVVENKDDSAIMGTSRNYIKVIIASNDEINEGDLLNIRVIDYKDGYAVGNLLNKT